MSRFIEFTRERQYLHNVSPATLSWYASALKWLPSESPTQDELKSAVLRMREKGLKETGCNSAIRTINAYLHWASGSEHKCGAGLHSSSNFSAERAAEHLAHVERSPSEIDRGLEARKEFPSKAVASSCAVVAGLWLPNFGSARIASPQRGHGEFAHHARREGKEATYRPV